MELIDSAKTLFRVSCLLPLCFFIPHFFFSFPIPPFLSYSFASSITLRFLIGLHTKSRVIQGPHNKFGNPRNLTRSERIRGFDDSRERIEATGLTSPISALIIIPSDSYHPPCYHLPHSSPACHVPLLLYLIIFDHNSARLLPKCFCSPWCCGKGAAEDTFTCDKVPRPLCEFNQAGRFPRLGLLSI